MPDQFDHPRLGPAELVQAAAIARRFHVEGVSKVQIGQEFGLSRFKVARILADARAAGIVQVEIRLPARIDAELSTALRGSWGLQRAVVVDTADEPDTSLRAHLAAVTADLLAEIVTDEDVLGLTWSRTIDRATTRLRRLARCTVVQLAGTLARADTDRSTVEIVRRAAAVGGGRALPVYAPLIVEDGAAAAALRRQPDIAGAFAHFDRLTKAVVAVGSWEPGYSTVWDAVSVQERESYRRLGARAEVSARLLDAGGRDLVTDLDGRVMAITTAQLREVPEVIAVVGGSARAHAAEAALRSGFVTTLVTDAAVARHLLHVGDPSAISLGAAGRDRVG